MGLFQNASQVVLVGRAARSSTPPDPELSQKLHGAEGFCNQGSEFGVLGFKGLGF